MPTRFPALCAQCLTAGLPPQSGNTPRGSMLGESCGATGLGSSGGAENSRDDVIVFGNYDVIRLFSKPGQDRKQQLPQHLFFIKPEDAWIHWIGGANATRLPRSVGPIHL